MDQRLKFKTQTIKLSENRRVNLYKPGFANGFLDMTSKHQ